MSTIVYVANADSEDISVLALDEPSGALSEVERFAAGGAVMPLAASPDGRVLYASIRSEPPRVLSLAIDRATGRLAEIGRAPLPASMCWISTDRSGRFLLFASYGSSLVAVSPIDGRGVAGPASQVVDVEEKAHSTLVDPSNRFAYTACLGGGLVRQWHFDAAEGRLVANPVPAWQGRSGAGPRHLAFHPSAPFAYLLNELDATLDVLALDAGSGSLTTLHSVTAWPAGASGEPWAADIHLTPDGRFLYASERRTSTISAFAVDAGSGRLRALGSVPTATEPRGFAITPDGRFLFAAGQASHRLARHAIDRRSGALQPLADLAVGENPNWVEIVRLPA